MAECWDRIKSAAKPIVAVTDDTRSPYLSKCPFGKQSKLEYDECCSIDTLHTEDVPTSLEATSARPDANI